MTVQITDEQVARLQEARTAIGVVISRNKTRWVDIELMVVRATLDEVLAARSQSGQKDD
jgi:hypothetical protein